MIQKNMKDNKKKILIVLIAMFTIVLCACGVISNGSYVDMIQEDAEAIISGIKSENYGEVKEIFSPYVKEKYPNIEDDIAELVTFIDGEIVSFDPVSRTSGGGTSENGEWIVRRVEGIIRNVKTDNGKTYTIEFKGYAVNKENPNQIGIDCIIIESNDERDVMGYYKEKGIGYR